MTSLVKDHIAKLELDLSRNEAAVIIQRRFRRKKFLYNIQKTISMNSHRNKIVREIYSTEKTYVSQLSDLINNFDIPLGQNLEEYGLSKSDHSSIFSIFQTLFQFHSQLLHNLEERLKTWTPRQKISDIFLEMSPYMKMYAQYLQTYDPVHLKEIVNNNKKFRKWLKAQKSENGLGSGELYLASLLILPVQRIPRYELLIRDLIKYTSPTHEDYADLTAAYQAVRNVADYLNKTKSAEGKHHNFEKCRYKSPTWCDHCNEFLWGVFGAQGYFCTVCNFNAHKECINAPDLKPCVHHATGVVSSQTLVKKKMNSLSKSSRKLVSEIADKLKD